MASLFGSEPLASLVELVYVDAPSLAQHDYGWWHAKDARGGGDNPGVDGTGLRYEGWARTRDAIVRVFETQGPFDGVFGFSQGAALAGLLVGLRAPDGRVTAERPLRFDFAVMAGGFPSRDPDLARLYERHDSYEAPSLHMLGRSDRVVPMDASRALASHFARPVIVEHGGGHVIASDARVREQVRVFLEERATTRGASGATRDSIERPL